MKKIIIKLILLVPCFICAQIDYSSNSIINEDITAAADYEVSSDVASIQLTEYYSANFKEDSKLQKQETCLFDNGKVIQFKHRSENEMSEINFTYNDKQQLIKSVSISNKGIKEIKTYTYQNNKIKTMSYYELSPFINDDNLNDIFPTYVITYQYQNNYIIKSVGTNSYKYELDSNGRIVSLVNDNTTTKYKYADDKTLLSELNNNNKKKTYTYNQQGNLERISEFDIIDETEKLYNKNFYTYIYDKNGNWVERKTYDGTFLEDTLDLKLLRLTNITKRKITYSNKLITGSTDL